MSPGSGRSSRTRQRGAIGLVAAITLGLAALMMLVVVDSGRLYLEQRKLQRVADMAALEAASRGGHCTPDTSAATYAAQNATRNGFTVDANQTLATTCGALTVNGQNLRTFAVDAAKSEAIRVVATRTVTTSIAAGVGALFSGRAATTTTTLSATAVAGMPSPLAMLTIRTVLGTIDSTKSAVLNAVVGGLLGGTVNISALGWDGLAKTDIKLLSFLDQLAVDLNVKAGDYDTLLATDVSPTKLLDAAIKVLPKDGSVATVTLQAMQALSLISRNTQLLKLGDLIKVQTGTTTAGLDSTLQLFQLVQGVAQLSNSKTAVSVDYSVGVPNVATVTIKAKVIEAPQMSAIGNPKVAKAEYAAVGPVVTARQIFVRTAQVRTLVTLDLPVLKNISALTNGLSQVLTPVVGVVNNLLGLKLTTLLDPLLCILTKPCVHPSLQLISSLDVSVEAAPAKSFVTDYNCDTDASKSLTAQVTTALANLGVGRVNATQAFSSAAAIVVDPVRLVDIGTERCYTLLFIGLGCEARIPSVGGWLDLKVQTSVASRSQSIPYPLPPNIGLGPLYKGLATTNIITSLGDTLTGVQLTSYAAPSGGISAAALAGVAGLLSDISAALVTAIKSILGPLLDPIVNSVLSVLGVSLGNAEVGANLSCHAGGRAQLLI